MRGALTAGWSGSGLYVHVEVPELTGPGGAVSTLV